MSKNIKTKEELLAAIALGKKIEVDFKKNGKKWFFSSLNINPSPYKINYSWEKYNYRIVEQDDKSTWEPQKYKKIRKAHKDILKILEDNSLSYLEVLGVLDILKISCKDIEKK
jgi:hypothetical protein